MNDSDLEQTAEDGDGILCVRNPETHRGWNGIRYKTGMSAKNVGSGKLSMNVAIVPPGAVAFAHIHVDFEVMLFILEGSVRHEYGENLEQSVDNSAGDFIFIQPGVPHEVINLSDTEPVIAVAIEPRTRADQDKLTNGLVKLTDEDPTFRVFTDPETNQTIISGMGELHLEIIVDRLKREFGVEANIGRPQVAYRETIRNRAEKVEGRFVRQTGGRGQYGHVVINIEPGTPGSGFIFEDKIHGGSIPREYISSVEAGLRDALDSGVLAGYPVIDVKVELIDGSYHDVDSSEMAFKIAGSMALKAGIKKAKPVLLEPIMDVEVVTPADYMGDIIGDLSARRGKVGGMTERAGARVIGASVPLGEMFGYSTTLRSMSQGRAVYTMQFAHYDEVPKSKAEEIMAANG